MIIEILVLSSLAIGAKKYYQQHQLNQKLNANAQAPTLYQKTKVRLQAAKKKFLLSLMGGEVRYERLKLMLRGDNPIIEQKRNDQNLRFSIILIALALIGTWFYAPLLFIVQFGLLYLLFPMLQKLFQDLRHRRITSKLFEVISIIVLLMMKYIFWATCITFVSLLNLKLLQAMEHHSARRIIKVFFRQQQSVWVMRAGMEMETPLKDVKKRDIVVVNTGDTIWVDGIITQGTAKINQYKLTGKLQPVTKQVGDEVFATTRIVEGRLLIRVKNTGTRTVAAKMGHIAV